MVGFWLAYSHLSSKRIYCFQVQRHEDFQTSVYLYFPLITTFIFSHEYILKKDLSCLRKAFYQFPKLRFTGVSSKSVMPDFQKLPCNLEVTTGRFPCEEFTGICTPLTWLARTEVICKNAVLEGSGTQQRYSVGEGSSSIGLTSRSA